MNDDEKKVMVRVIDLKQYVYCPRVFYYQLVLPQIRPITYKMEAGIQAHVSAEKREKRRSLRTYGLTNGDRSFNVPLYDQSLGLSGEVDMLIETESERIPIDYKFSKREGAHFRLQLLAYGNLLASGSNKPVRRGFLYLIPKRKVIEVKFTPALKRKFQRTMVSIQVIVKQQRIPVATTQRSRCVDCEFRRFCNDVL